MPRNIDKIFIRDLYLNMSVGIHDHERECKQKVIVNITIEVESNIKKKLKNISDVISYEEILNSIISLSNKKHYDLLEEFAEDIADICLSDNRSLNALISVDKPDIIKVCNTLGVEIFRIK